MQHHLKSHVTGCNDACLCMCETTLYGICLTVQCTLIRQYSHWWMSQGAAVRQETAVEAELPAGSLGLQSISLRQHSFSQLSEKDNPVFCSRPCSIRHSFCV